MRNYYLTGYINFGTIRIRPCLGYTDEGHYILEIKKIEE
jgi:hypothetical protein